MDVKETDKGESVDNLEVNEPREPESSSSSKTKRFGMFRLSGKKSKGDKKSSKQSSRESLKKEGESSPDSVRYEKRESSASLEESTSSNEPVNGSTETGEENHTQLQNMDEGFRNAETEPEKGEERNKETKEDEAVVEANETQPENREEQSKGKKEGEAVVEANESLLDLPKEEDDTSDTKEDSAAKQEEPDHSIETTPLHEEDVVYRLETSKNEQFEEECANIEERSPVPVVLSQMFEFEQHPLVIPSSGKEESKKTADKMTAKHEGAENLTEDQKISGRNFAPEPGDEISLEDLNKEQEKEVTSSEESSVDTVISAEYANAEVFNDTVEAAKPMDKVLAAESKTAVDSKQNNVVFDENATDAEETITATYKETKRSEIEETEKREVPEEAIVLEYTGNKEETTTEKTTEELHAEEQPIVLTERKIEPLLVEITPVQDETGLRKEEVKAEQGKTFEEEQPIVLTESRTEALQEESMPAQDQPEVAIVTSEERKANEQGNASVEGKPTVLIKIKKDAFQQVTPPIQNESDMLTGSEKGENKAEPSSTSAEEPVEPSYIQRNEPKMMEQSAGDTSTNEDTMVLSYPENDGKEIPKRAEPQIEEAPMVLTYSEKQQESISLLQEDHHLILEDENPAQRDKDEKVEEDKEENCKKEIREKERSIAEVKVESPFISQEPVQSSTPKQQSNEGEMKEDHAALKAGAAENKPVRGQRVPTEYKVRSVVEHYNSVLIVRSIRGVKMSNNRLLNQLIEENKKLRALQSALRKLINIKTSDASHDTSRVLEQEEEE